MHTTTNPPWPTYMQRLEKIARLLADVHIELSIAAKKGLISYPTRNQKVLLHLQEHCLANIRQSTPAQTDPTASEPTTTGD